MPRVYLTQDDRLDLRFLAMIAAYKSEYHLDNEALADAMGLSPQTLYRRLKEPSSFTLGEMRKLRQKLKIPREKMPLPGDN